MQQTRDFSPYKQLRFKMPTIARPLDMSVCVCFYYINFYVYACVCVRAIAFVRISCVLTVTTGMHLRIGGSKKEN